MKVALLILSMGCGGSERAAASLCNCFVKNGVETELLVLTGKDSFYPLDSRVHTIFFDSPALEGGKSAKRLCDVIKRAYSLRNAVKKEKPDVLVGMSYIMSVYTVFCTKGTKIKAVGTERSNPFTYKANRFTSLLRRMSARLCDGYVHQTHAAMNFFPKSTHNKSEVIQNAVFNTEVYEIFPPQTREKTVTAMGRLIPEKGFDCLIRAFATVAETLPDYTLVIYGEGRERASLEGLVKELGLTERVILPGESTDAVKNVAKSSLFVLSSRCEGMPNALMEAMACGVPCISTDCDMGPSEIITDGENGLLVPVDDEERMSKAMLKVLTDAELSASISKKAFAMRESNSIETIGEKWLEFLKSV